MKCDEIIKWLLAGDVSIQYQVYRDLISEERADLQKRIATEGFGAAYISKRNSNGHWGEGFYKPKWTSSHYTLLVLRNLCISPNNDLIKSSVQKILATCKAEDGGIFPRAKISDVCVNGMFLNYASYFKADEILLKSVIDCLLKEIMLDGGFNCRSNRSGATHSSLHSTLSVLEGLTEYYNNKYTYRLDDVKNSIKSAQEFILLHQLFLSDRTGEIIDKRFLRLAYPGRWRYDILRALDCFRHSETQWDDRMLPAIKVLTKKRKKDHTWNVQAKYPGKTHLIMEKAGKLSRWNTLRALRVLKYFDME